MIGRVATFSQTLYVLDRTLQGQARLAQVQAQTASGLKSDTFGGLGAATASILRYEADRTAAGREASGATSALSLVEQAYGALGSIEDLAGTILSSLAAEGDDLSVQALAQGWLDDLESLLNSRYGGEAVFAGDAMNGQAVDLDLWTASGDAGWYTGGSGSRAFATADGKSVALSIEADHPALAGLVDALKGLSTGAATSAEALDAVREAVADLGVARAALSSNASRLERMAEQATAREDALTGLISTLKEVDLAEAAVLATQYETLLQTAYSTLNTLMSVKLSDYLR